MRPHDRPAWDQTRFGLDACVLVGGLVVFSTSSPCFEGWGLIVCCECASAFGENNLLALHFRFVSELRFDLIFLRSFYAFCLHLKRVYLFDC